MSVPVSQCSVFIQIWVDTNSVQNGQTKGIYLVDNRVSSGSQNEGSASLQTACTLNSYICWQILAIDPNYTAGGGTVAIQQIGNSNAWGMSGQPEILNPTTFTGQVQNAGQAGYSININVQNPGMSGITIQIKPSMLVTAAAAHAQQAHSEEKVGAKA
jgi:hypothetical protein